MALIKIIFSFLVSEWKMVSDVSLAMNNWIKEQSILSGNGIIMVYRTQKINLNVFLMLNKTKVFINYNFVYTQLEIFIWIMKPAY